MKPRFLSLAVFSLVLGGIGTSWLSSRQARAAETACAALAEKRRHLADEISAAERSFRAATDSRTEFASRLATFTQRPKSKSGSDAQPPNFIQLLEDNPSLQILKLASRRAQLVVTYGPFYRVLGLTPPQIDQFEQNILHREEQLSDLWASSRNQGLSSTTPAVQKLAQQLESDYQAAQRDLLGEAGAKQLANFELTTYFRENVCDLAGGAAMAGTPFDAAQAERLLPILIDAAATYPNTDAHDSSKIDWSRVETQAKTLLTADQLAAIDTMEFLGARGTGARFLPALHGAIATAVEEEKKTTAVAGSGNP